VREAEIKTVREAEIKTITTPRSWCLTWQTLQAGFVVTGRTIIDSLTFILIMTYTFYVKLKLHYLYRSCACTENKQIRYLCTVRA